MSETEVGGVRLQEELKGSVFSSEPFFLMLQEVAPVVVHDTVTVPGALTRFGTALIVAVTGGSASLVATHGMTGTPPQTVPDPVPLCPQELGAEEQVEGVVGIPLLAQVGI